MSTLTDSCVRLGRATRSFAFAVVLVGACPAVATGSPEFTTHPILRPETGAHTALVNALAVDPEGRFVVSGSHDKTVRVWELSTGRPLGVLRIPIDPGEVGKIYAVAMSPDARLVAVGGWTGKQKWGGHPIYLIDRKTGDFMHRIPEIPGRTYHLAFSPDGRRLAASTSNGVRVFDTEWYKQIGYDFYGSDTRSYWCDFDQDGRLIVSSLDGQLRLYDGDYNQPVVEVTAPGGSKPNPVVFSPDGKLVAVGYQDTARVDVLRSSDLELLYSADTTAVDHGNFGRLAWSTDGFYLYATGRYTVDKLYPILRWDDAGRGNYVGIKVADKLIYELIPLQDGRLTAAWGSGVAVLNDKGAVVWEQEGGQVDFRGQVGDDGPRVSEGGNVVEFGLQANGAHWVRFDVAKALFDLRLTPDALLSAPITETPEIWIDDWENSESPKLGNEVIGLYPYERARSISIDPERQRFLLGADWRLRLFDWEGNQLDAVPVPGKAWAVNLTSNGTKAIAGFDDGTLRWYEISEDGKLTELLALFARADGRWATWTPEGYFHVSPGAEELFGWHRNLGHDEQPDFTSLEQLWELFKRPDLVTQQLISDARRIMPPTSEAEPNIKSVLGTGKEPRMDLVSTPPLFLTAPDYMLKLRLADRGGGLGHVSVRVNGVERARVPKSKMQESDVPGEWLLDWPLSLRNGNNQIEVVAYNGRCQVASEPLAFSLDVNNAVTPPSSLYGMLIGISNYRHHDWQLNYADEGARDVAKVLAEQTRELFDQVDFQWQLVEKEASRQAIQDAFSELAQRVGPEDVFILYLAGHAMIVDAKFYFVPQDADWSSSGEFLEHALDYQTLRELLAGIQTETSLMLLDTADAASFVTQGGGVRGESTAIERLTRTTGRPTLAFSLKPRHAREGFGSEFAQHDVFTHAFLRALSGLGDQNGDGQLGVGELATYIGREVPRLSLERWGFERHPRALLHGYDFVIAITPTSAIGP